MNQTAREGTQVPVSEIVREGTQLLVMTGNAESLELADACILAHETRKEAESDVVEDCCCH